jgi:hypothetical protein
MPDLYMSIFDDFACDDDNPPNQDETAFSNLNWSNRVEAARVRQLIDTWVQHYPEKHRESMVARFRSVIDDQQVLSMFAVSEAPRAGIVLGYGAIRAEQIPEGLRRLRKCFDA